MKSHRRCWRGWLEGHAQRRLELRRRRVSGLRSNSHDLFDPRGDRIPAPHERNLTMSNEQKTSARNGFLLGIGTAAIIGALAIVAVLYDGTAKAVPPLTEPVAAAPASL